MTPFNNQYSMTSAALIFLAASGFAAPPITEITLPATRVFPESITSTADGTLIVGSIGHRNVMRIAAGKTVAEEWIKPGTGGLAQVFGVYADEKGKTLWVCSNNLDNPSDKAAVKTFDLGSGAPKGSYTLPGTGAFCNDIAVAGDGTAYVADTGQGRIVMLKSGAKDLEIAAKDPLLAGADGLAGDEEIGAAFQECLGGGLGAHVENIAGEDAEDYGIQLFPPAPLIDLFTDRRN